MKKDHKERLLEWITCIVVDVAAPLAELHRGMARPSAGEWLRLGLSLTEHAWALAFGALAAAVHLVLASVTGR